MSRPGPALLLAATLCAGLTPGVALTPSASARSGRSSVASAQNRAYGRALALFRAGDLNGALRLLEDAPAGADVHNLRGVIFLRQREFDRARAEFAVAAALDSSLWEAAYNAAEADFRQGRYAESRREFIALLPRADSAPEREFLRYKILLAGLLNGQEEPVERYLAETEKRGSDRPAAYFYLRAALARQHGQTVDAGRWLAQVPATISKRAAAGHLYADSFHALGWKTPAPGTRVAALGRPAAPASQARVAVVQVHQPAARARVQTAPVGEPGAPAGDHDPTPPVSFRLGAAPASAEPDLSTPTSGTGRAAIPFAAAAAPARPPSGSGSAGAASGAGNNAPPAARAAATPAPTPAVPGEAFNAKYESAYRAYAQHDFPSALRFLDEAEEAQAGLADAANLRGLIFSRQRRFDEAEGAFRKAVAADPTFWAAKFNLAELPFGYKNYTEARKRFESLFAETDPKVQPREAELTEFKVFLTLLLEGKEGAARSFMNRFKPDGATPARLYAQAALDFHGGKFDKAIESVSAAKKAYPAPLEAIFAESFYRIGWLTDAKAPAVASASPTPPATAPDVPPAASSPAPGETLVAAGPTPETTPAVNNAPAASPTLVASSTPVPAEPSPAEAMAAPPASPPPSPVVALGPSPTPTVKITSAALPPAVASAPADNPAPTSALETRSAADRAIRVGLPIAVLLYVLGTTVLMVRTVGRVRRGRSPARRTSYPPGDITAGSKV